MHHKAEGTQPTGRSECCFLNSSRLPPPELPALGRELPFAASTLAQSGFRQQQMVLCSIILYSADITRDERLTLYTMGKPSADGSGNNFYIFFCVLVLHYLFVSLLFE
jgi:hypothetical protein